MSTPAIKICLLLLVILLFCFVPITHQTDKPKLDAPLHSFPANFYWGASTAAYQVEGDNTNNWSVAEPEVANQKAANAQTHLGSLLNWPAIKDQASNPNNYISGKGDNSVELYPQDITLAKSLNLNSYRFSIEWSRIEPEPGTYDQAAITYYKNLLNTLHGQHIEPFVTLWHFTLPTWVADQGGWTNKKTINLYNEYVHTVVTALSEQVTYWITLNEIEVYANQSYLSGIWTPYQHNIVNYLKVTNNLIAAHKAAYDTIKAINPNAQVGLAKNNTYYSPYKNRAINVLTTTFLNWWGNEYILNQIEDKEDFIGLNYYIYNEVNFFHRIKTGAPVSDMGWELHPEGLYLNLKNLAQYKKPVIITEEGLADASDSKRAEYIKDSITAMQKAMDEGVDVRGYLHWSLLDNFEWAEGYWPRFGLIAVDRSTLTRTIRPSAQTYADLIKQLTPP